MAQLDRLMKTSYKSILDALSVAKREFRRRSTELLPQVPCSICPVQIGMQLHTAKSCMHVSCGSALVSCQGGPPCRCLNPMPCSAVHGQQSTNQQTDVREQNILQAIALFDKALENENTDTKTADLSNCILHIEVT